MLSSLVGLSAFSRILTFAMNTILARGLGPQWYAIANVQLQLLTSSSLFLSHEGIRRACQRIYSGGKDVRLLQQMVNLAWLSVPITLATAVSLGWYSIKYMENSDAFTLVPKGERMWAICMVCTAAVVEAFAAPGWVYAQQNGLTPMRALAEGSALVVRALITCYLAVIMQWGAIGFGIAQLLYAIVYVILLYAVLIRRRVPSLWPRRAPRDLDKATSDLSSSSPFETEWLSEHGRTLGLQYCGQSVQKYLLTEGERLFLVAVSPLAEQGVFALVSNLGSLVARLLFAPLEEAAFASFSRQAARGRLQTDAFVQLYAMLRAAAIFGGIFIAFGPAYSWLLLHLLYGPKWSQSEAPAVLSVYCFLVCAMGLNGIAEAFVNATATAAQLRRLW